MVYKLGKTVIRTTKGEGCTGVRSVVDGARAMLGGARTAPPSSGVGEFWLGVAFLMNGKTGGGGMSARVSRATGVLAGASSGKSSGNTGISAKETLLDCGREDGGRGGVFPVYAHCPGTITFSNRV